MEKNNDIELIFERLEDPSKDIQSVALEFLLQITKGVSTITAKAASAFDYMDKNKMRLEGIFNKLEGENKRILSDILSVIFIFTDENLALTYRTNGDVIPLETFGHLYVKKLLGSITKLEIRENKVNEIAIRCINFLFSHNLECDAIDFSQDLSLTNVILENVDTHNYERIVLYLNDFRKYDPELEEIIFQVNMKMRDFPSALLFLVRNNLSLDEMLNLCNLEEKIQISFMLGKMQHCLPQKQEYLQVINNGFSFYSISSNNHLNAFFKHLINDLNIEKPRKPFEFLKGNSLLKFEKDVSLKHLPSLCISNSFVHLGFGEDAVFLSTEDALFDINTIDRNVKYETLSIFSSFGAINVFSQKKAIEDLNEFIFSDISFKKSSALLGLAIANSKVFDDNHTTLAFLNDNLTVDCPFQIISTLLGLQMIYSDSQNPKVRKILVDLIYSPYIDVACFAVFCLGSIFCGSGDPELFSVVLHVLSDSKNYASSFFGLTILGVSLLFFKNKSYKNYLETLKSVTEFSPHCSILIKCMGNFGSGDVDLMNEVFADCFEENEGTEPKNNFLKVVSIFSVTFLSLGDEHLTKLAIRIINSCSLLENEMVKSAIPLCIALISASNPQIELMDSVIKSTNSSDNKTVINSIIGLGILGAGTNNTRISEVLERLYGYYNSKITKITNVTMLAQGLLHLGKGTMTLSPFIYHKNHLLTKNFIGLLAGIFLYIDPENSPIASKHQFLNYFFVQASSIKQVLCVDKEVNFVKKVLRIGNPVNNVGVVGRPKKIASVQTHNSPIVVQDNEMVELNDECFTRFIEDVVVVKD